MVQLARQYVASIKSAQITVKGLQSGYMVDVEEQAMHDRQNPPPHRSE